jgi:hypothetical protein
VIMPPATPEPSTADKYSNTSDPERQRKTSSNARPAPTTLTDRVGTSAALYQAVGVVWDDLIPQAKRREVQQPLTGVLALSDPHVRLRVADDVRLAPAPAEGAEWVLPVAAPPFSATADQAMHLMCGSRSNPRAMR